MVRLDRHSLNLLKKDEKYKLKLRCEAKMQQQEEKNYSKLLMKRR